ncbi:hypothetical protein [Paraburkholderia humisilvae]|nr:hypothetical protein [Paraburkholderia humisilvae]
MSDQYEREPGQVRRAAQTRYNTGIFRALFRILISAHCAST